MSDTPEFIDLINRLRAPECRDLVKGLLAAFDGEHHRGEVDARRRIMEAAEADVSPPSAGKPRPPETEDNRGSTFNGGGAQQSRKSNGQRAPRGAPDALVTRVLAERGSQGASSREIEALAQSDREKLVSQSGIRFALERGREIGKYRNDTYGRWFLVRETEN